MTDEKPTIAALPNVEHDKLKGVVEAFRRNLPLLIEDAKIRAQFRKTVYDEYIRLGFKPEQALELIKTP